MATPPLRACADTTLSLAEAYVRLLDGLFTTLLGSPPKSAADVRDDAERRRMRLVLWRLERAYEQAAGDDPQKFFDEVVKLTNVVGDLTPAVLVWVDTIESLVQQTERIYGPGPGQGPMKMQTVKSALTRVLIGSHLKVPDAIDFARPLVLEAVAEWTIDALVLLLNKNDAWMVAPDELPAPVPRSLMVGFRGWVSRLLAALIRPLKPLLSRWALVLVEESSPLTPEVQMLMAKLYEKGADPDVLLLRMETLIRWLADNRRRVLGMVQVISVGIKEAERFVHLSGPQKKLYVRNLVMLFLEDEGILDPDGIFWRPVESLVDSVIESVVQVFRRRGVLSAGSRVLESPA